MSQITPQVVLLPSGASVTIRSANPSDAEPLCAYLTMLWRDEEAFNVTAPDEAVPTVEDETQWILTHRDAPDQLALVVEDAGRIVGLADMEAGPRRRIAHSARLGISLAAGWRNQGIGTTLMQTLLDWARSHPHIEKVTLAVLASNHRAMHVYQRLGFREEGRGYRAIKYGEGENVDDILLYCWVK